MPSARGKPVFNLIDTQEGGKVDFWLITDEEVDRTRFDRRYVEVFEATLAFTWPC